MTSGSNIEAAQADVVIVGNGALGLFLAEEDEGAQPQQKRRRGGPEVPRGRRQSSRGGHAGLLRRGDRRHAQDGQGRKRFEIGGEAHKTWDATISQLRTTSAPDKPLKMSDDTHIVLNPVGHVLDSHNFDAIVSDLDEYQQPWSEVDARTIKGFTPGAGFISCVSNPKAIISFRAFFPGFIDPKRGIALQSAVYGVAFIALDVCFIIAYTPLVMAVLKVRALRWMNPSSLSAIGLCLIGALLLAKGSYEVLSRPA